jgi:hypothetical protein
MAECTHTGSYHRYGSDEPTPTRAQIADGVSVALCSCGKVALRFHRPATTTNPGQIFAAAYLDAKDCTNLGDSVLRALYICRHNITCNGSH